MGRYMRHRKRFLETDPADGEQILLEASIPATGATALF